MDMSSARRLEALKDPNSAYFRGAEKFLSRMLAGQSEDVREVMERVDRMESRKVPYAIAGEDLKRLSGEFGWLLTVNPRESSKVPFVASKTYCAGLLNESVKSWPGEEVVHLEGDITSVVAKHQQWKHVCWSDLNSAALVRHSVQRHTLNRMKTGRRSDVAVKAHTVLQNLDTDNVKYLCTNAATCGVTCDTVLVDMHHACLSMEQAAATIVQHCAARLKAWFYFDVAMLESDCGVLTAFPGHYMIDRDYDRVYLVPEGGGPSDTIEYVWSHVRDFATQTEVHYGGRKFLNELHDAVPGVLFAVLSDASGTTECDVVAEHRLFYPAGVAKVDITQRVTLPKAFSTSRKSETVIVRVQTAMWQKMVSRMMATRESKLVLSQARVIVADTTQQRVDVGAFVRVPDNLPYDVPEMVARALWKHVTCEKLRMRLENDVAQAVVDDSWATVSGKLIAVAMRAMHETQASIQDVMLDLNKLVGRYAADIQEYEVHVVDVPPYRVVGGTVEVVSDGRHHMFFQAALPGGPDYTPSECDTEATQRSRDVRCRAMDVMDELRRFDVREAEELVSVDGDQTYVMHSTVHEAVNSRRELGVEREKLVDKMMDSYDGADVRGVARVEERLPCLEPMDVVEDAVYEEPISQMQENYAELFPALSSYRAEVTPYAFGDADKSFDYDVPGLNTSGLRDRLPEPMRVRMSKLRTACSGRRPVTQSEALTAFCKRVANAPNLASDVVTEERLAKDFCKFQSVVLREGWQERVQQMVEAGLWSLDITEIRKHVAKLSTSGVGAMINEDFNQGKVDFTRWKAMVKGTVKPKMSEDAASTYAAPQTIVYQASKMTNSMFSPLLSKVLDVLDQELVPWVRINARRDEVDDENWSDSMRIRSKNFSVNHVFEADITQCDKSQNLYNLTLFLYVVEQLGAPTELVDLWRVMIGRKSAEAADVGMVIWYMYQVLSGFFGTIAVNSLITIIAMVVCTDVSRADLICVEARGDDLLARVACDLDPAVIGERYTTKFNFEAKIIIDAPPYFCSRYEVIVDDRVYRPRDPVKATESLGRYVSPSVPVSELYEAYKDSMRHYERKDVMDALDEAVQKRMGVGSVRAMIRAHTSLKLGGFEQFCNEVYEDSVVEIGV